MISYWWLPRSSSHKSAEKKSMNSETVRTDREAMRLALQKAKESAAEGEVPVGAVLLDSDGSVLSAAGNRTVSAHDPAGHAEIRALREGARLVGNYRLPGTSLFVTLEPCAMCAAALVHARVARLVFGAVDPKAGAVVSRYEIGTDGQLNHRFEVTGGVLEEECGQLLKDFFRKRR